MPGPGVLGQDMVELEMYMGPAGDIISIGTHERAALSHLQVSQLQPTACLHFAEHSLQT